MYDDPKHIKDNRVNARFNDEEIAAITFWNVVYILVHVAVVLIVLTMIYEFWGQ